MFMRFFNNIAREIIVHDRLYFGSTVICIPAFKELAKFTVFNNLHGTIIIRNQDGYLGGHSLGNGKSKSFE